MRGMPDNAAGCVKAGARMTSANLARTVAALVAIVALTAVLMLVASAIRGAPLSRGGLVVAFIVLGAATSRLIRSRTAPRDP